jgi:catechol 2,3-dioxygenase-like lactoylglutathione lyase family enzyme
VPELRTPQPARHLDPTVEATALAYLIFERPDLDAAERFLCDFGLALGSRSEDTLYLRGTSPTPYCYRIERAKSARFVGFGLSVGSRAALDALSRLPGASPVQAAPHPGGGECVALTDPSGFIVEAIHGRHAADALPRRAPLSWNVGDVPRRINDTQRPPLAAPEVMKLGHLVLEAADFQATCAFYTQHFGFIPSDVQVLPDGSPAVVFLRLDLGDTPTDHHTLAIAQGFMPAYSHSAYELVDVDAVGIGQQVLRERGWKHAWGIGRHILGSQIFDYWQDPWGAKHEHYCDGDLFTAGVPMGVHPVSRDAMSQWGPAMPSTFTRPTLTPGNVAALIRNLRRSPDLSLKKLITLARLFG